jgi:hypothetical protein
MSSLFTAAALAAVLAVAPSRATASPALAGEVEALEARPALNFRALLPGLAQISRGERVKGWAIIALESTFLAGALELQLRGDDLRAQSRAQLGASARGGLLLADQLGAASAQRFRFRDGFLVAAAAVWALSLVDGHLARPALRGGDAPAIRDQPLLPTVCIERRGVVAGISLKF